MNFKKQKYTKEEALERLQDYCAKQERSRYQLEKKLYEWNIPGHLHDDIFIDLIQDNFINEERFAQAYARSKMRMNQWGRRKIQQGLQQHRVSKFNAEEALAALDLDIYFENIQNLIEKKWKRISHQDNLYARKQKLIRFMLQRGFLMSEISSYLEELT